MHTIDHRHIYGIMLDTETANTIVEEDGRMDMRSVLPYDIGFAIIDTYGRIYETHSFINSDIFFQEQDLMASAYYAKKIPQYQAEIAEGKRIVANTYEIRQVILSKVQMYNIKFVCAHNARFDNVAMNNIIRWTTKSKYRYFFPYGIEFWDTLRMAREVVAKTPTYRKYCETHGYMTKSNQVRLTAEILYRYITGNEKFKEEHTGLEDVLIEVEIFKYCRAKHKKMEKRLYPPRE